jgi:16S rRNA processing protein RimM
VDRAWTELGRLGRPYGLKGWLHCESFTDPPENLFKFRRWRLKLPNGTERAAKLTAERAHGERWVVQIEGLASPEQAQSLTGSGIWVARVELPPTAPGEFYQADLIGLRVRNTEGQELGTVDHFVDAPANTVMVVTGARQHWLPVSRQHLLKVDLAGGEVLVDWPVDL